jgi:ankyrin repeat protein
MTTVKRSPEQELIRAVIRGDAIAVQELLDLGVDANTTGGVTPVGASNTALMWAASEGYQDIFKLLLDRGADLNAKNSAGYTTLMFASEGDRRDIVSALLDNASLDPSGLCDRNSYQETVLMAIAKQGQTDIVQRLVKMGAEINAVNRLGDTALYLAADRGHLYTVKALCELGAEVNTANRGGWTPLMMSSALGHLEIMEILLQYQADYLPKNNWHGSALSEARKSIRANQAVEILIRAGATE